MKFSIAFVLLGVTNGFTQTMPRFHRADRVALNVATSPGNRYIFDELGGNKYTVFPQKEKKQMDDKKQMEHVVLEPDYKIANGLASIGAGIMAYHTFLAPDGNISYFGIAGGLFHMMLAATIAFQTARIRCVFEKDGLEVYNVHNPHSKEAKHLVPKPGNWQTGLKNRWAYDKITNYRFFPSKDFPAVLYFKETQTPKKHWHKNVAFFDSKGKGQPHFLPALFNAKEFKEELESHGVTGSVDTIPTPLKSHYIRSPLPHIADSIANVLPQTAPAPTQVLEDESESKELVEKLKLEMRGKNAEVDAMKDKLSDMQAEIEFLRASLEALASNENTIGSATADDAYDDTNAYESAYHKDQFTPILV